jgi:hypothetical protein
MSDHRYSVAEIDAMRRCVRAMSNHYNDKPEAIEARLRTYMVNGTTVAELEEAAERHFGEAARRQNEMIRLNGIGHLAR